MNFKKNIKITLLNLLSIKKRSNSFLFLYFIFSFFTFDISKAENDNLTDSKNNQIKIEYLKSKNELEDYIIDTGDVLSIDFQFEMFNGDYRVNEEGELFLPEIDETYVRGLTTSELTRLLNENYKKFLIDPEIKVRIATFKSMTVSISGELRNPGFYKFPAYKSDSIYKPIPENNPSFYKFPAYKSDSIYKPIPENNPSPISFSENIITISDVISKAGGITSLSDLSKIQIIRDNPIGKGGGKKRAFVDFYSYINGSDPTQNIRIFDGDILFLPKLNKPNPKQIPKSILAGISPRFITVNIFGRIENAGSIKLPLEATLSDAIDLTGPIKPLSGKIVLIRYNNDGTILKKNISYSANAKRGSGRNPFVKEGDLITVKNSFIGKTSGFIKEVTSPFIGIYTTKELIENFSD